MTTQLNSFNEVKEQVKELLEGLLEKSYEGDPVAIEKLIEFKKAIDSK